MNFLRVTLLGLMLAWAGQASALGPSLPFKQDGGADDALVLRALGGFLLACAVAGGAAWAIKRHAPRLGAGRAASRNVLEQGASMRLSPRSTLVVVRYHGREFLLADSSAGVTLVAEGPSCTETVNG
jgi:hypothetical protein